VTEADVVDATILKCNIEGITLTIAPRPNITLIVDGKEIRLSTIGDSMPDPPSISQRMILLRPEQSVISVQSPSSATLEIDTTSIPEDETNDLYSV